MQGEHLKIYRLDLMQSRDNCKHFQRDYGAILMNRVGRKGYKIHIQVVGLLWDFRFLKHFFLQIWFSSRQLKTSSTVVAQRARPNTSPHGLLFRGSANWSTRRTPLAWNLSEVRLRQSHFSCLHVAGRSNLWRIALNMLENVCVGILKLCISESAWTRQESIVGYYENKEV